MMFRYLGRELPAAEFRQQFKKILQRTKHLFKQPIHNPLNKYTYIEITLLYLPLTHK